MKLLAVTLWTLVSLVVADPCNEFTLAECSFESAEVIYEYNVHPTEDSIELCQLVCQTEKGCNFFRYTAVHGKCVLLRHRAAESCEVVSGLMEPDLNTCIDNAAGPEGDCTEFLDEDCTFDEDPLVSFDAYDAVDCQEELNLIGSTYAATYFVYDGITGQCDFYETGARTCVSMNGPAFPSVTECGK